MLNILLLMLYSNYLRRLQKITQIDKDVRFLHTVASYSYYGLEIMRSF